MAGIIDPNTNKPVGMPNQEEFTGIGMLTQLCLTLWQKNLNLGLQKELGTLLVKVGFFQDEEAKAKLDKLRADVWQEKGSPVRKKVWAITLAQFNEIAKAWMKATGQEPRELLS